MLQLLLIILVLCLLALRCRRDHPGMEALRGWAYAHRGLHGSGIPENSMAAFRKALASGYGIELDIHLLRDGNLAVIHDSLLNRTTGQAGHIEDLCTEDLAKYPLEGTAETIPEFMDVLTLYQGKAPLIVELKPENGNHAALAEAACQMLSSYQGPYCIESFDPRCVQWLRKNRPEIIRGQLTENFTKSRSDLSDSLKFILTHNLLNFTTLPDFIAYRFDHRNDSLTTSLCRHLWKAQGVTWTLRSQADFDTAVKEGWLPIFEGFLPGGRKIEG